jgi:hypothetical protein
MSAHHKPRCGNINNNAMKRILFLHGLESSNICDKTKFLSERSILCAPRVNYMDADLQTQLSFLVESFKPDLIIGSSMGGYVGLQLANHYDIKSIVFNPAIHSRSVEPAIHFPLMSCNSIPIVVLGLQDTVIDPNVTKSLLSNGSIMCQFEEIETMQHRVAFDVFVDIYNKHIA